VRSTPVPEPVPAPGLEPVGDLAARLIADLVAAGHSVATAESLTGGLVVATLIDVPGASAVVTGGIVAYQDEVKTALLGVSAAVLLERGAVCVEVAEALATGARERLGATWGVGTTGVAGPGPAAGVPAGTVFVAVAGPGGVSARALSCTGSRAQVRAAAVAGALQLLGDLLTSATTHPRP